MPRLRSPLATIFGMVVALALFVVPQGARADDTIKNPGDHPSYAIEMEPHLSLGLSDIYGSSGLGVGGRFSVPVVQNGFVSTINNSVAVGFGLDLVHYSSPYKLNGRATSANYLFVPVVMQWNFFVARQWSVFGEPGIVLFHGFFDVCGGRAGCADPEQTGWRPAIYLGGRYHFNEKMALIMRVGYPAFSIGLSFF